MVGKPQVWPRTTFRRMPKEVRSAIRRISIPLGIGYYLCLQLFNDCAIPDVVIPAGVSVVMMRSHLKGVITLRRKLSIDMTKICRFLFATLAIGLAVVPCANSQNVELAKDLAEEGVTNEAKIEFLKVLHDPAKKASYDVAQYYLGYLSFKEQNYERALKHWNELSKSYPSSPYTERARQQIQIAYQLLSKQQAKESENIEIGGFFDDADFLVDEPLKVSIDTSYLPKGDMAIEMLDQIVAKYPHSPEAARALFREVLVLYGWGREGRGQYSPPEGYGFEFNQYYAHNKGQAQVYVQKMLDVLHRIESTDPTSPYVIPMNFLIGQAYWSMAGGKTDDNARTYWQKVIDLAGDDKASSYRQIAEWRLRAH